LTNYRTAAGHVIELIGNVKLADLKAREVQAALTKLAMQKSTRSVRMYRMVLVRAIRHAQINDLVMRKKRGRADFRPRRAAWAAI
jgi:hypothetical protein